MERFRLERPKRLWCAAVIRGEGCRLKSQIHADER
jgi:hypothetical protein